MSCTTVEGDQHNAEMWLAKPEDELSKILVTCKQDRLVRKGTTEHARVGDPRFGFNNGDHFMSECPDRANDRPFQTLVRRQKSLGSTSNRVDHVGSQCLRSEG